MRSARLLILFVALVAGAVAALLAMRVVNRPPETIEVAATQGVPQMPTAEVLVALADIPMGSGVSGGNMGWRVWPEVGLSPNYIVRSQRPEALSELSGSVARSQFDEGEPIKETALVKGDGGFLAAMLPAGMRAIALSVDAARTAGGFILPNDRVDVLLVRTDSGGAAVSETILSNIRVLAIDQSTSDTPESGATVVALDTATLELTPEQAELLTAAQQSGTLSLILRSLADAQENGEVRRDAPQTGVDLVRFGVPSHVTATQ